MLLSSCRVALLLSSFIMSEWSDFYRTLNRIGPKLLAGVHPELQGIIELEASDGDAFFSDGLEHIFETWWEAGEYEKATFDALEEWARNVINHLGQLLGPHSAFPSVAGSSTAERDRLLASIHRIKIQVDPAKLALFIDAMLLKQQHLAEGPILLVQGLLEPLGTTEYGKLVRAIALPWQAIVSALRKDWSKAYQISSAKWEEIVAAAFDKAGYDEVVLTPRSGDHGRDVIAVKRGVGTIRIIDSVKAYKPGHLVRYDDVRALAGVLLGDQQASKGIVTTTSTFAPGIVNDPFLKPLIPYRLELMDGQELQRWLEKLATF
jgi:restriction system protein